MTLPIFIEVGGRTYRLRAGGYIEASFCRKDDPHTYWRVVNRHGPTGQRVREAAGLLYPKPVGPAYQPWTQEIAA